MIVNVMICLPMSGKTESEINTRLDEMMDTYGPYFTKKYGCVEWHINMMPDDETIEKNHPCASLYFLGRGIMEYLSKADIVLFDSTYKDSRGCGVEMYICNMYSKPYMIASDEHLYEQMKIMESGLTLPGIYKLRSSVPLDTLYDRITVHKESYPLYEEISTQDWFWIRKMTDCDYMVIDHILDCFREQVTDFLYRLSLKINSEENKKLPIAEVRTFKKEESSLITINRNLYEKLVNLGFHFEKIDNTEKWNRLFEEDQ